MGRVEPVEQLLVPRAPLPVVQQHQGRGEYLHPLVAEQHRLAQADPAAHPQQIGHAAHVDPKRPRRPGQDLDFPAPAQGIQQHPAQDEPYPAVGAERPVGQHRPAEEVQGQLPGRRQGGHQCQRHRRPEHPHPAHKGQGTAQAALPQPVDALPQQAGHGQVPQDAVHGIKAVRPAAQADPDHELDQAHPRPHGPKAEQVGPAVVGMGKALRRAEQEQGRAHPPQHREPFRHRAGEGKEIVDVVQHHQRQGDLLERCVGQAPGPQCFQHSLYLLRFLVMASGYRVILRKP